MIKVFLIAGEASGDVLGASLMQGLKRQKSDIAFFGVGGPKMREEGLKSLFPMQELSVMGIAEILPRLFTILRRISQTAKAIVEIQPDVVVTIDSPDFCFRVIKKAKAKGSKVPFVHYVAPSVWAWRPKRAEKVARFLDHLLALLPFEPPYFTVHGLQTTFVGHPIVECVKQRGDEQKFRQKYKISADHPIISLLPGSRMSELDRLLDKFTQAVEIVLRQKHQAVVVVPTLPHLEQHIRAWFVGKGINPIIITDTAEKFDAFAASSVAIAASGTVSLELAVSDTPHIIAYKLSPLSAWLARYLVKTPFVNLVNILLKRTAIPELLLENCEPQPMAKELLRLMDDREARAAQMMDFRQALIKLGLSDPETPEKRAADAVIKVITNKKVYKKL
jgi:lipid-A-disaccharide synthase